MLYAHLGNVKEVAIFSLVRFLFTKLGVPEAKSFLDELAPYLLSVSIALGIWIEHGQKEDIE
ncbi:hypothetical protein [Bacillus rhizoplanae]|uniref:hypothetical protein n=1 Tax=Bacillus rhizoplanae TaxID=2880966 RepID=UPI003D2245FA